MKNTDKFTGLASHYASARPSYSKQLIDYLYEQCGFTEKSVIADIGSGTGKFAKLLLERGSFVYGVEPNKDMRDMAMKELGQFTHFKALTGSDSATGLMPKSVDFVTVAQAFHWFDEVAFQWECSRILKPEGKVFLIWNVRDQNALLNQRMHQLFEKYCPNFPGFSGWMQRDDYKINSFFNKQYEVISFSDPLFFTKEKYIQRCLSASYSLQKGEPKFDEYVKEIEQLFNEYAVGNLVEMPNQVIAYVGYPTSLLKS
ncbi:MAG: class I SAM-dependent methyltransferase [Solibacillus sp.]|uniref:class I SAM-dependent methyltransferase n=1 Tax=unclassified Solibacillus TaxID=2637870 RepID=UPI0030FB5A1E